MQDTKEELDQSNTIETNTSTEKANESKDPKPSESTTHIVRRGDPITIVFKCQGVVSPTAVRKAKLSRTDSPDNSNALTDTTTATTIDANESTSSRSPESNEITVTKDTEIKELSGQTATVNVADNDLEINNEESIGADESTGVEHAPKNPVVSAAVIAAVAIACLSGILFYRLKKKNH